MTKLQRRAMARLPMDAVAVEAMYTIAAAGSYVRDLCESHERLRAEMAGLPPSETPSTPSAPSGSVE